LPKDDEKLYLIAGMPASYWLDLFFHTHPLCNDLLRVEWPGGGFYLEQDNILIEIFDIIKLEALERLNEKRKNG